MGKHVLLHVLLLLECLVAAFMWALKCPLVTAHMPVEFAFTDKVAINADWTLELGLLFHIRSSLATSSLS